MPASDVSPILKRLLDSREYPKTICPSEVARAMPAETLDSAGASDWRDLMPAIRALVWEMRDRSEVDIMQRGEVLGHDVGIDDVKGPIRVRWQKSQ